MSAKKRKFGEKVKTLNSLTIYKTIKRHPLVDGRLTESDIEAVLKAYADIIQRGVFNGFKVLFPTLGSFSRERKKGWVGRELSVITDGEPFSKQSVHERKFIEGKPDYYMIQFKLAKSVKDEFKKMTEGTVVNEDE